MARKGFSNITLIVIIAVLALAAGGYFAWTMYQAAPEQQIPVSQQTGQTNQTSMDETAGWKTYANDQFGFEVNYPPDWKITDTSKIVPINGTTNTAVNIESPSRTNLPGYEGVAANYRILIYLDSSSEIQSVAGFGTSDPKFGHQSARNLNVDKKTEESTNEYRIGQQIIASFKLTSNTASQNPPPANSGKELSGLAPITLPSYCSFTLIGSSADGRSWTVDCGTLAKNGGYDDARGFMGKILKPQNWKYCSGGAGSASWWKDGVVTAVSEGETSPRDVTYPFYLSQRKWAECQ